MQTTNEKIKKKIEEIRKGVRRALPVHYLEEKCPAYNRAALVHQEGCVRCLNCGWGKCE